MHHFVAVRDAEVEVGGREIGEPPRIRDIHAQDSRHFVRNSLDQLGQRLGGGDHARHKLADFVRIGRDLARGLGVHDGERLNLRDLVDDDAPQSLQRDLHGVARKVDPLVHSRGDADLPDEAVEIRLVVLIARGDHQRDDEPRVGVRAQHRQILRRPHLHGDRPQRIHDRRAQRHQRQAGWQLGCEDLVFAFQL